MTVLNGIFWSSWVLAGISLVFMLGLILRRLFQDQRARRLAKRRERIKKAILQAIDDPTALANLTLDSTDAELAGRILSDLMAVIRGESYERLKKMFRDLGIVRLYLADLESGDTGRKIEAVTDLALFPDSEVEAALWRALEGAAAPLRLAIAFALLDINGRTAIFDLVTKLEIGTVVSSRGLRELFRKMAECNTLGVVATLRSTDDPRIKVLAISGLAFTRDFRVLEFLTDFAKDSDKDVRAEVIRSLGIMGHPASKSIVLAALDDPGWEIRAQAAIAAGRIGILEAVPRLAALLGDVNWWPRFRAAESLSKLGKTGIDALRAGADRPGEPGRVAEMVLLEMVSP
jgi:HEAT repeat protein